MTCHLSFGCTYTICDGGGGGNDDNHNNGLPIQYIELWSIKSLWERDFNI